MVNFLKLICFINPIKFQTPPFGGGNFWQNRLGDFITRSPSLLYYDLANVFSKVGVKTRHIGEDVLKHIAIDAFMGLDVFRCHLKGLVVHGLTVKPHVVEVCALVIDNFFAKQSDQRSITRRLADVLLRLRLILSPLPRLMKSWLPVIAAKRCPPICWSIVFAIILSIVMSF